MRALFEHSAKREYYRWASVLLLLLSYVAPIGMVGLGGPEWLAFLLGLPFYLTLVAVTYRRLRNAGLSSGWLIPMILVTSFGPKWQGVPPIEFYAGDLLGLIPVILGWLVQEAPQDESASIKLGSPQPK